MIKAKSIIAGLALQKYWNSGLYGQAAKAIATYSQRLSKPLGEWAAQDATAATTLQQASYTFAKKEGVIEQHVFVEATAFPVSVPTIKAPEPDDKDAAIAILTTVAASEFHCARVFTNTAADPAIQPIFQILDLKSLAQTSLDREQIALEMREQVKTGRFWQSAEPINWHCLQCGARTHGTTAFETCDCCKASRAFATSATF